ncbi:Beta protein [Parafrankia irregularis]|uniref:Beta protein n=1 Tax=Parafrankia irregularis TaxID=795642 RepID=A0A0S4QUS4_9ACTN|nr:MULTISPECIES: beta family protein [Parafrankia]MBE3201562.1 beta family protein [Parafrankia sp. CH37]CUU59365.1 Beta protein [Parafrankia irregularis]
MAGGLRYVPILLARGGEREALREASRQTRSGMIPMLVAPPVPRDFKTKEPKNTVGKHLDNLLLGIADSWTGPAFVDLRHFRNERSGVGTHLLGAFVDDLAQFGLEPIPTTSLNQTELYNAAVAEVNHRHGLGVCLRLPPDEWPSVDNGARLTKLLALLRVAPGEVDLVLDLGTHVKADPGPLSDAFRSELLGLPFPTGWRSATIAGTAFPSSLSHVPAGLSPIDRTEWAAYRAVVASLPDRPLAFGDYAVANPDADADPPPRWASQKATLRYTSDGQWIIGRSIDLFRGRHGIGKGAVAMSPVAGLLYRSPHFAGREHCPADRWIAGVAEGRATGGNGKTWRRYGTLHHLTTVSEQLAGLFGS